MNRNAATIIFATIGVFILVINLTALASGQTIFQVQSTNLTLYRDGLVHCEQTLTVYETVPDLTIPLLSNSPENVLLLDENKTVVDYKLSEKNLTAYTLGAKRISIEYDTISLTQKQAEVWTLLTNYQYDMTIFLPQNSTVVYMSEVPSAIETKENTMTLSLPSGQWEISYILPVNSPKTPEATEQTNNTDPILLGLKTEYLAAAIVAIVAAAAVLGYFFLKRKRGSAVSRIFKANPQLSKEDQEVIQFLAEKEGKAFEAELREKFPNMPRTSLWRLVRRLERLDIVEIKKIGLENQVQLKK